MKRSILLLIFLFSGTISVLAQNNLMNYSQQFRLASRIIRVAEPGELSDSVNVWGDLESTGRYLIPRGTTLTELFSYSGGMNTINNGQTQIDWSKMRVEVYVHQHTDEKGAELLSTYKFRFEETFPAGMWTQVLKNNQTVTVRVKRRPSFRDYLGVFASTISAVASTIILLDRLGGK